MKRLITGLILVIGLGGALAGCQTDEVISAVKKGKTASEVISAAGPSGRWKPFSKDLIHDPQAVAYDLLQRPWEAFAEFPSAPEGNQVDWVRALREGYIEPREKLYPETQVQTLDLDVYFTPFGHFQMVKFPHDIHTEWLGCNSCHDKLFKAEIGASDVNMIRILRRQQCGYCHSKVAFPLTQCTKCHAVPFDDIRKIVIRHERKTGEGMRVGSGKKKILHIKTKEAK